MKDKDYIFKNKVIVITGAASGIGLAFARYAASLKMKLVLADVEKKALQQAIEVLTPISCHKIIAEVVDIRKVAQVKKLADCVLKEYGVPDILINNAGVGGPMNMAWQIPLEKLKWVMDVNFYGMVHGVQAFLPHFLADHKEHYIINIASMAGFYTSPYLSAYEAAKHAVVAWSEALYHDLCSRQANVFLSLVSPGWVKTNILNDTRNDELNEQFPLNFNHYNDTDVEWIATFARAVKKGISPEDVAKQVFSEILEKKFYIFTHPEMKENITLRAESILNEHAPIALKF